MWVIRTYDESGIKDVFWQASIVGNPEMWLQIPTEPAVIRVQEQPTLRAVAVTVKRHETATGASHGTEAGHKPAAAPCPNRPRSDCQDSVNKQCSATNDKLTLPGIDSAHNQSQQAQDYEMDGIHGYSGDEDYGETNKTGSRDVKKRQSCGIHDNTEATSHVHDPAEPDHRATKRPRFGSVTGEPARSILRREAGNTDRLMKKVLFDVDSSESTEPVPRANTSVSEAICDQFAATVQLHEDAMGHAGEGSKYGDLAGASPSKSGCSVSDAGRGGRLRNRMHFQGDH